MSSAPRTGFSSGRRISGGRKLHLQDEAGGGYQTWWATSATSSSLRCWVSSLMRFPPMDTGENPHWVDSASRSLPTYRAASSMRAMSSSAGSISGSLLDTRPSTTTLSSGTLASGSKEPDRSSSYSSRNTSKLSDRPNSLSAVNSYPPAAIQVLLLLPLQMCRQNVTPGTSATELMMSTPSVSVRSVEMPRLSRSARFSGSTSVPKSGESIWM